ncbi:MAG: hypothetical protein AABW65_02485, partial [Nanoarchaeota archaeon]
IASYNGNVGIVSFDKIKGNNAGYWIADNGKYNILDKEGKYSLQLKQFVEEQKQKYQNREQLDKDIQEFIRSLR